ncbi:MAG: hypothetical protein R2749_12170 [Acidimicrobiales bacterium]
MTAALVAILVVLVAGGAAAFVVMRRNGDPRRAAAIGAAAIDPFTVNEPWRRFVQDALKARTRFEEAVHSAAPGPLRDRLDEIGRSLEAGVERTWATARQGQALRDARRRIDTNAVSSRLSTIRSSTDPNASKTVASLEAQLALAQRLDSITREAESKLRLLQAQLEEAVARAAELSVRAGDAGELAGVQHDIAEVSDQLEALRLALQETNQLGGNAAGGIPQADH